MADQPGRKIDDDTDCGQGRGNELPDLQSGYDSPSGQTDQNNRCREKCTSLESTARAVMPVKDDIDAK
jgi:hypothetical protein